MNPSATSAMLIALNVTTTLNILARNALTDIIWTELHVKSVATAVRHATMLIQYQVTLAVVLMAAMTLVPDAIGGTSLMWRLIARLLVTQTQGIYVGMIAQRTQLVTIMY